MTAPVKPPTTVRGHVSSYDYATLLDELTADLPADLIWPTSTYTYASMRRESRLSAILAGWGLQLRRAQWQVDGTGCRPEVVQLVADDLGLPVAGRDEPTAARVRGVSWHEHLRAALPLTFGHSGFEMEAAVRDGRARLAGLYERPPWTVGDIHVDPKSGAFLGITQDSPAGARQPPQIRAEQMAWYCREREGTNWAGTSLLKAAFPAWLVKREMLRTAAIAHRRWSAGVPVLEALPGTSPTPAQMAEAQALASAARAGDQAGAATPPGFTMKIMGISGSVPDTTAFIEFLNRELATAALMQHIDLGNTQTGSRALGQTFVDSFMLALETEGESVTDVATRQVAARIVAWNWGEDEPVPRVTVSGIGSRREITAESLQLLLSSGALSAEPGLEEWVRREYRLPARTERRPVQGTGADLPDGDDGDQADDAEPAQARPVQAATPRRPKAKRRAQPGQYMLPVMAQTGREPTELEQQSGTDFEAIAADIEQAQQELAGQWPTLAEEMTAALVAAVVAAVAAGTLADLGSLAVPDEALAPVVAALTASMTGLADTAAGRAATELRGQGADIEPGTPDADRLADGADAIARIIGGGYATGAGRVALQHAGPDADPDQVGDAVREHLDGLSEVKDGGGGGWVSVNLGGALAQAVHAGRTATFADAPAGTRWLVSAVNDRNVCKPCSDADGEVFDELAEALTVIVAGSNPACLGGLRCRCLLVALAP